MLRIASLTERKRVALYFLQRINLENTPILEKTRKTISSSGDFLESDA